MKIVGVTTLDSVRANKFVAQALGVEDPSEIDVQVVGGHAGSTILPLFSQAVEDLEPEAVQDLDKRVQDAGTEVVDAKNGKGSATLSMAYAGARLANAVLAGLDGEMTTECAYVQSSVTDSAYFASPVTFGRDGVAKVQGLGKLSDYEQGRLEIVSEQLNAEIEKGLEYARSQASADCFSQGFEVVAGEAGNSNL